MAVAIGIPRCHKRDVLVTGHALGRRKTARAIAQQQKHTVARPHNNVRMTVLVPVARNNMAPCNTQPDVSAGATVKAPVTITPQDGDASLRP